MIMENVINGNGHHFCEFISIYAGISIKVKQAMLMTFYTIFSSCPPGNGPQDGLPSTKCGT